MTRIGIIHWNDSAALEHAQVLQAAGYEVVEYGKMDRAQMLAIRDNPPGAFVIDLARTPSNGQSFAVWLRQQKNTRRVPIIFAGGSPDKVAHILQTLPDIPAAQWDGLLTALQDAIANPLENPLVPGTFDIYSGTPLPKKLGIKAGSLVTLLEAPAGFEAGLPDLPQGARLERGPVAGATITLLFARSQADLEDGFPKADQALAKGGRLWILWPKKASGISSDLGEREVRKYGLSVGYVDYKISAIDQTWSGLCFTRRQAGKTGGSPAP